MEPHHYLQLKNVEQLSVIDTVDIIRVIMASFPDKDVTADYVNKHDLVVCARTSLAGENDMMVGLVMIRVLSSHCSRCVYELNSLCTTPEIRNCGVASDILAYVIETLPCNAYAKLFIDRTETHDALLEFYRKRGFYVIYTNDTETCMRTRRRSWVEFARMRSICFSSMFCFIFMFSLFAVFSRIFK